MDNSRLDKIEDMLATLITMVGNNNNKQSKMEQRLGSMEQKVDSMEQRLGSMEQKVDSMEQRLDNVEQNLTEIKNEQSSMREEIMTKLTDMQADQNYIWEKAAKNERELAIIKSRLQI